VVEGRKIGGGGEEEGMTNDGGGRRRGGGGSYEHRHEPSGSIRRPNSSWHSDYFQSSEKNYALLK
jgi:hypothetical protein